MIFQTQIHKRTPNMRIENIAFEVPMLYGVYTVIKTIKRLDFLQVRNYNGLAGYEPFCCRERRMYVYQAAKQSGDLLPPFPR